jgi:hypothetical protein
MRFRCAGFVGTAVACALASALAAAPPSDAATYYVAQQDAAADDANPGTEARPWKDACHAAQQLQPGDTLIVKAGRYYRHTGKRYEAGIQTTRGGTAEKPIVLKAHPGDEVVLMGGPTPETPAGRFRNPAVGAGGDHVVIDGFRIYGAVGLWSVKDCIVRNCEMWGGNDGEFNCCVRLERAERCRIENNIIHDNDGRVPAPAAGGRLNMPLVMEYDSRACVIEHNEFYNAAGAAVFLKDNPVDCVVRRNLFWGTGGGVTGPVQDTGENLLIEGNVFRGLTTAAVYAHCDLKGLTVRHNTFVDNATDVATWTSGTAEIRVCSNLFVHTAAGQRFVNVEPHGSDANRDGALTKVLLWDYNGYAGPAVWRVAYRVVAESLPRWQAYGDYGFDAHSLAADPEFVNPAGRDYRLKADSPYRGKGMDGKTPGAYTTGEERVGIDPTRNRWAGDRVEVEY